jgi:hypothetical protein
MDELDLVGSLRAEVPTADVRHLSAGRDRLLAEIDSLPGNPWNDSRQPSRGSRRNHWRLALPSAITMLAAAAATAGVLILVSPLTHSTGTPPPSSWTATPGPSPAARAELAAQWLQVAADAVARQRADRPNPTQWFYVQTLTDDTTQGRRTDVNWNTFDGRWSAYYEGTHLVVHDGRAAFQNSGRGTPLDVWDATATPLTAYDALASLPSDPHMLITAVDRQLAAQGPGARRAGGIFSVSTRDPTPGQEEFAYLANLLWNAFLAAPPTAVADVYRAIATIPGITTQYGITNVAGAPAVGLAPDNSQSQLLLDPHTFQVIGLRLLSPGPRSATHSGQPTQPLPPKGTVTQSLANIHVSRVTGPGQR